MNTHELKPLSHGALNRCFGCGQTNRAGLRLKFFVDEELTIVCRVRLAQRFEGPPGHAHGGIIATLLDEAMSKANRQFGVLAMTRQMEIEYLKPVPLGVRLLLTGRRVSTSERKHHCEAQIANEDGKVLARGKALFIAVDRAMLPQSLQDRI
ncbi:MAG TPA: PaaI family thioesterase [Silvibacterium sp.]|nr:PaaI family thioesterase [Silvibacterium sp.]